MKNIVHQIKLKHGVRIELAQSGRIYIVEVYYSDGSRKDVKFFGNIDSAGRAFNNIIDKENFNNGGL